MGDNNIPMMSTLDVGDKVVIGLGVEDVGAAMQRFGWPDYIMFVGMLLICISIGLYYAFCNTSQNAQEYLVGGRNMKVVPVALSLVASFISGISLLGIPTEIYVYGIQYMYIIGGFLLMTFVMASVYLPVFQGLKLTSTYEYHERRFDRKVRLFGSLLFTFGIVSWLPLVIYVPALAFNQVTGVNVHLITPIVCVICIFYTSMGGLKAVVWTDVIQIIIMFGAMILVAIKGTLDVGGFKTVFQRNWASGRIEGPNFDLDPLSRHTIWSLVIGGSVYCLQTASVNQNMIQRYLALPSLQSAKRALWVFFIGIFLTICLCSYCGLLIYATFYKCDPLTTMLAREKDQLLPLLVMDILGDIPGLPGVIVAGIFSAALSSLSTGLNAMSAVVLEDFYKPFFRRELTEKQTYILMKLTVIFMGFLCVGMVFVVEKLGAVLQLTMSIGAIANGPALGIFTMGILLPWVNSKIYTFEIHKEARLYFNFQMNGLHVSLESLVGGICLIRQNKDTFFSGALTGGITSLLFMSWLCLRAQTLIASGDLTFPEKPVSTEGCHYHFTPKQSPSSNIHFDPSVNITNVTHTDERYMIYRLSYLWYTLIGTFVTMFVGLLVTFITRPLDPRDVDPQLLAPFIRKLIKPRLPKEGFYTYGSLQANGTSIKDPQTEISMEKYNGSDIDTDPPDKLISN